MDEGENELNKRFEQKVHLKMSSFILLFFFIRCEKIYCLLIRS